MRTSAVIRQTESIRRKTVAPHSDRITNERRVRAFADAATTPDVRLVSGLEAVLRGRTKWATFDTILIRSARLCVGVLVCSFVFVFVFIVLVHWLRIVLGIFREGKKSICWSIKTVHQINMLVVNYVLLKAICFNEIDFVGFIVA